ncbi:biopolymer transporter ExbD [Candidatus Halobeggiatoa sp. HSG11]|nr:biopolymer transporter ExbD [Candidatus Halobeggiatoa sp. HSG11]
MKFRRHKDDNLKVNLTPLIDTVFILLIFFMMTTTFNRETQLKINLPEAKSENSVEQQSIKIIIDEKGEYAINDFEHTLINSKLDTLKLALKKAAGEESNPSLLISADKDTPHFAVVKAMEAARDLGFLKLGFEAQQKPK